MVRRPHSATLIAAVALMLMILLACLPPPSAPCLPAPTDPVSSTQALNKRSASQDEVSLTSNRTVSPFVTTDNTLNVFERTHSELCPFFGSTLQLLILVTSAPSHAQSRSAIRLTWGHYAMQSDIALAFFIGIPPVSLRSEIETEDLLYGDIIIGGFVDSYYNLTVKTISMLQWTDKYCHRVPRMLKTDDDMFINVPKLMDFIKDPSRINMTKMIWGRVLKKSLPKRSKKSKYFVAEQEFPGKVYPNFATGPAYLLTTDILKDIIAAATTQSYLRLEDVFITGVIADKLGIKRQHAAEFYNRKVTGTCMIKKGIAIHRVEFHEQFDMWRKLQDLRTAKKCVN